MPRRASAHAPKGPQALPADGSFGLRHSLSSAGDASLQPLTPLPAQPRVTGSEKSTKQTTLHCALPIASSGKIWGFAETF